MGYKDSNADDDPQVPSNIRWYPPDVAKTWPLGSIVLLKFADGMFPNIEEMRHNRIDDFDDLKNTMIALVSLPNTEYRLAD